jgi:tetratricopeptide (TPR) repeat protein
MASFDRLTALRQEFENSRSPLAFLPYALALRAETQYLQAIEVCQRGLTRQPESVAAQTLLGRLYCDIGSYPESRAILECLYEASPEANGIRLALARTYLRVHEVNRAEELLFGLTEENPDDPEVQVLNGALRYLQACLRRGKLQPDSREEDPPTTVEEVLEAIVRQVSPSIPVTGAILTSLQGDFGPVRTGVFEPLRAAAEAFREMEKAYGELEMGEVLNGELEFAGGVVLFARRSRDLVLLALAPSGRVGRAKTLLANAATRFLPLAETADTVGAEVGV